nr:neuropeptide F-like isoform X2 [Cherax quadricarinatus]
MYRQMLSALLVGVVVVGVLEMGVADAKPAPPQVAAMADALKYLQELDKYYSQVSRPRPVVRASAGPCQATGVTWTLPVRDFNSLRPHISRFGKRSEYVAPADDTMMEASERILESLSRRR